MSSPYKRILLPEPPPPFAAAAAVPEIFQRGQQSALVRRAVIIGNGAVGCESQCYGLVQHLGLLPSNIHLHRVWRPSGGIHDHLRWLPVQWHQRLDTYVLRTLRFFLRILLRLYRRFYSLPPPPPPPEFDAGFVGGSGRRDSSSSSSSRDSGSSKGGVGGAVLALSRWFGEGSDGVRAWQQQLGQQQQVQLQLLSGQAEAADAAAIAKAATEGLNRDDGPLLVVACGRDTVGTSAAVKKQAGNAAFVIQIQHPRCEASKFDLVVTPQHDMYALTPQGQQEVHKWLRPWVTPQPPAPNMVLTTGSLHLADATNLRSAAASWHAELAGLRKPLVVVNIGGPTRHCRYGEGLIVELAATLKRLYALNGGSIRVSFSRRTPTKLRALFCEHVRDHYPSIYMWSGEGGANPHLGHLAWGDAFVITADSVNMLSEACSTGKPVYVVGAELCTWKLADFHRTLHKRGATRPLTPSQDMREFWSYPPLHDLADVAARVRAELAKKGWTV